MRRSGSTRIDTPSKLKHESFWRAGVDLAFSRPPWPEMQKSKQRERRNGGQDMRKDLVFRDFAGHDVDIGSQPNCQKYCCDK